MLETLGRDIRFAWRSLRRAKVLAAAAMLSIGLGIGTTTAVFSIVDAALFRPPPLHAPERLMMLYMTRAEPNEPTRRERWSWRASVLLRERTRSFDQVASFSTPVLAVTSPEGEPEPVNAEVVSSSYWPVLRVSPVMGGVFTADADAGSGSYPVVIVGYDLWQRRFGGDASLVGRTIAVNGVTLTVIGIAPRGFAGLSGRAHIWVPATMAPRLT